MQLIINSPSKKEVHEVAWVEFNTPTGNYIIQPGHAPTVLILSPSKPMMYALKNGKEEVVMVHQAIAEITRLYVRVLLAD